MRWLWAAALVPLLGAAETPRTCGKPDKRGVVPRMADVLSCQQRARAEFAAAYRRRHRRDPPFEAVDRFDDLQRAEMRAYLEEYPRESTIDGERAAERQAEKESGAAGVVERVPEDTRAEREARQTLGALEDGSRMGEVDLEAAAERARRDPEGTLKRAVKERNEEFEENVPDEVKKFYDKPKKR